MEKTTMTDDGIQVWAPMEVVEGLLARAEKAEAAIERVREACRGTNPDRRIVTNPDRLLAWDEAIASILRALDGDNDE